MNLNVDLKALFSNVETMGAQNIDFTIGRPLDDIGSIGRGLVKGIEVELKDIEYENGLLSYKGHQILLYIQDHSVRIDKALIDGGSGNRYHVADCRTLHEMREKNRFSRYVATNKLDGQFFISGKDVLTHEIKEGQADLKVCKNCLKKLNYKGFEYGGKGLDVFRDFDLNAFFATYSSFFKHHPMQKAGVSAIDDYTDDWPIISGKYKADKGFTCEQCHVDLSDHHGLLHTHHLNGVKKDNLLSNLRALCSDCHKKQDFHSHMFVSHSDMRQINNFRRSQGKLIISDWDDVFKYSDTAVHGLLKICRITGKQRPEISYRIKGASGKSIAELEIAWPEKKLGVAISKTDVAAAEKVGWRVYSVNDALVKCQGNFL